MGSRDSCLDLIRMYANNYLDYTRVYLSEIEPLS
jgi:hypothetical protein